MHETYCGDIQFDSTIYSADNGSLHLEFYTDGINNFRGFAVEVQALRKRARSLCFPPNHSYAKKLPAIDAAQVCFNIIE